MAGTVAPARRHLNRPLQFPARDLFVSGDVCVQTLGGFSTTRTNTMRSTICYVVCVLCLGCWCFSIMVHCM
jgi:hypothetical protein